MKTKEEREHDFMVGLSKLTRETGIAIAGCGCCGSPWLNDLKEEELSDPAAGYGYGSAGNVHWISPANAYDWENYRDKIVQSEGQTGNK